MVPIHRITDGQVERFVTNAQGNIVLGNLRSGARTLDRLAQIEQNFAGERMVVLGMPGKGKSQLIRSMLSQAMAVADDGEADN
jgi:putative ribosome biogenesis GTPase RsgA